MLDICCTMKATKYVFTLLFSAAVLLFSACNNGANNSTAANADLAKLFSAYWEENLQLYPFQATAIGDNRYNDQFPNNQTDSFRKKEMAFIDKYLAELQKINANSLNASDKESYDLLAYELNINKEGLQLPLRQ